MRVVSSLSLAWWVAMIVGGCGDETLPATDTHGVLDPPDVIADTWVPDTFVPLDVQPVDTVAPDTLTADTAGADTVVADTVVADTVVADTVVADTVVADTVVADTVVADTAVADTVVADTFVGPQACPPATALTVLDGSTLLTGQTFAGASDAVHFGAPACSDPPNSAERGYTFTLDAPREVYLATSCSWDCELVLTRDGCEQEDVVACATTLGAEVLKKQVLEAGTYYLFVEGDEPADQGTFDLQLSVNTLTGQTVCQDTTPLDVVDASHCEDPFFGAPRYALTLAGEVLAPADGDDFFVNGVGSCTHDQDHAGGAPDRVYTLTLPAGGTRDVEIALSPDGWDALLYVTTAPCGAVGSVLDCSDTSLVSGESVALSLAPGTYYVVVDGFGEEVLGGDAWGTYDLEVLVFDDACNQ